ncbi:hypothetical protein F4776DRAFT_645763 [Hypoxylon sp. NC0597]|nr:hypothetical protein F4776DRAFT_645763 [Hypoxylon sp. NC0597]
MFSLNARHVTIRTLRPTLTPTLTLLFNILAPVALRFPHGRHNAGLKLYDPKRGLLSDPVYPGRATRGPGRPYWCIYGWVVNNQHSRPFGYLGHDICLSWVRFRVLENINPIRSSEPRNTRAVRLYSHLNLVSLPTSASVQVINIAHYS